VVLITGGLGGIGRVVVKALANHGARVAVNDTEAHAVGEAMLEGIEGVRYFQADNTDPAAVTRLFDAVGSELGVPNVVCCHAGIVISSPYVDYAPEQFDRVVDVNLKGAFLVSAEAARRMTAVARADQPGRIVFTSSWVQDVPWPGIAAYNVSKSGLKMLMKTLAREVANRHIRVNAIAPGIVGTGMAKKQWDTESDYRRRAQKAIPVGVLQTPESVADAFVFLASDASSYMTGATLLVDGGCSLYPMDD
jgi:NAD(P)-dependent dehydrogenase (short-subunit alcohol dehydrogenase family)